MKSDNALRNYLIKYFLLILILVSTAEFFLNLLFHNLAYPWLEQFFGCRLFSGDVSLTDSIRIFALCFFWLTVSSLAERIPGGASIQGFASKKLEEDLSSSLLLHTDAMSPGEIHWYLAGLFCAFFLLFLIWLIPYIAAAVSFGSLISKKAAAIEAEKAARQSEYEKQRNLLLSDIAHDLKTPMTTVAGYASALSAGNVSEPEKQQEYLDAIYRKSMQMKELLQLLFEYVKLDSEGFTLKKEKLDLAELFRECIAELYTDLEEAGMEFTFDIPESPVFAEADRIQFSRALQNLLNNAWKHNPSGTHIHASLKTTDRLILLEVSDNGVPIPEDTAPHLFEPFVQGDASRSGKRGSGLGLSITKKIISMHDGDIALIQPGNDPYTKTFRIQLKNKMAEY